VQLTRTTEEGKQEGREGNAKIKLLRVVLRRQVWRGKRLIVLDAKGAS